MSHVGNGEHDFDGLEKIAEGDEERANYVKEVRIQARQIIDRLEPFHLMLWGELITILEDELEQAKIVANLHRPRR